MPLKRVYWITSEKHPDGYVHERPVIDGLRSVGIEVVPTVWDRDPVPSPGPDEKIVVRSPWDYLEKFSRFSGWLAQLPTVRVENSAEILKWNSEKTYLQELAQSGIPVVPTVWLNSGSNDEIARIVRESFPGRRKIVKPVLSAGSKDTLRLDPEMLPPENLFLNRPAMVQPYLEEIVSDGERCLVYFSGKFSHAIQKRPRAGDFRVQESFGGILNSRVPSPWELQFGDRILAEIGRRFPHSAPPLYARVDYVWASGGPLLMEVELLEPDLYFHHAPEAVGRFIDALR